jgi:hypothetical protein
MKLLRIGQFSQSPVLAVIQHFNLLPDYQIEITNVVSSPAQFEALMKDELDIALTSPDNVLLYGTTTNNPLKAECDLKMLRSIDRGLKLSLVSNDQVKNLADLQSATFSIDSITSGFAILLKKMLLDLKIDIENNLNFVQAGSTPKRLTHIMENQSQVTILNAESKIKADKNNLKTWIDVSEVVDNYLGTVICVQGKNERSTLTVDFMKAWKIAVLKIFAFDLSSFKEVFPDPESPLANKDYFELLLNDVHGMTINNEISVENLKSLIDIRSATGAYTPQISQIGKLISDQYD